MVRERLDGTPFTLVTLATISSNLWLLLSQQWDRNLVPCTPESLGGIVAWRPRTHPRSEKQVTGEATQASLLALRYQRQHMSTPRLTSPPCLLVGPAALFTPFIRRLTEAGSHSQAAENERRSNVSWPQCLLTEAPPLSLWGQCARC